MSRSNLFACAILACVLAACGENTAVTGPAVVDSSGGEDIAGDITPTTDTALPDAATSDTSGGCTVSSDCPGAADLCLGGQCVPQTACASDKQCQASGQVCDTAAGMCVACLQDVDCAKGQSCKAHKCLEPAATCTTTKECAVGMVCNKALGACVECATAADCSTGMACSQTVCVPMACKPGAAKCASSSSLSTCAADGLAWTTSACGSDKTCLGDTCKPVICSPNQKSCDGQLKVMLCDATGTSLSQVDTCDPASNAKNVCLGGTCVPMACQAGSKVCADALTLATCKADGTGYDNQPCGTGLACDGGACVATICKPLALACFNDTEVKQCNAAGTVEHIATTCKTGEKCVNGACVTAVCSAGSFSCAGATLSTCTSDGMGYSAKLCNDGDPCTTDGCDTVKGCTTAAVGCDDGNVCTTDSCDKVKGCVHANAPGACSTGDACTGAGTCLGGSCMASPVGTVGTIAGSGTAGYLDGPGSSAQFGQLNDLAQLADGSLVVADYSGQRIRKVAEDGTVSTIAGTGTSGGQDGPATSAQFDFPHGVLVAQDGTIYVSEAAGHRIRKIASGVVSTLAGTGSPGYKDALGTAAAFSNPVFMVWDATGAIVIADYQNFAVRRVSLDGTVTTIAGGHGQGNADGPHAIATLMGPVAVAYDPAGNLYITDEPLGQIRRWDVDGTTSTVFGSGTIGFSEKIGNQAQLNHPYDIEWHPAGFLVVNDSTNQRVRVLWPGGANATIAGNGTAGYLDGAGLTAQLNFPVGLTIRPDGTLLIAESEGHRIRSLTVPTLTCNDTNPCTADSCDAATGKCLHAPIATGGACEDGNKCTSDSTCDSLGKCTGGKAVTCDDSQPCTDDSCDLISGKCLHGFNASACEDNNPCTTGTICNAGGCGLPVFCDDGNPCTADTCSGGNCSHTAIASCCGTDAACDDGDGCTTDSCALTCDGTAWNGSCYKGVYANNTWTTAEQYCVSWGGHLASISSANENATVYSAAVAACGTNQFRAFIGLNDMVKNGQYVWTDGSPATWTNWYAGQPDNSTGQCAGGEDAVEMWAPTTWNDTCSTVPFYCAVCEKPLPPGTCSHTPKCP